MIGKMAEKRRVYVLACFFVPCCVSAGTVTLTQSDTGDQSSWASGLHWSDGTAPNAENDYVIDGNRQIRTPSDGVQRTFAGKSLSLGAADFTSQGDITVRTNLGADGLKGRNYINDLRLYKGQIAVGFGDYTGWLGGTATVYSPESAPFKFLPATAVRSIVTAQALSGAEGTGLLLQGPGRFSLEGENDGYLGQWRITGGLDLTIRSVAAFGGELTAPRADAVVFNNKSGILRFSVPNIAIPATRGVRLDDDLRVVVDATSEILSPISGDGTMTVSGDATLRLKNAFSAKELVVDSGGKVALFKGFAQASDSLITMKDMAFLEAPLAVDGDVCAIELGDFVYEGGALVFNGTANEVSRFDFRGEFSASGQITVCLNTTQPTATNRLVVMTVPVASKTLTADDFKLGAHGLNGFGVERIEVESDGVMQTVVLRTTAYVRAIAGNPAYFTTAEHWSDGQAVHPGAHYVVSGRDVRRGGLDGGDYVFPGDSLTLFNHSLSDKWSPNQYVIKQNVFTCADLRIVAGGGIAFGGGHSGSEQILRGHVTVDTVDDLHYCILNTDFRTARVEATFSGNGQIGIKGNQAIYRLLGDNRAFTGSITVQDPREAQSSMAVATLSVTNACNLGGTPAAFLPGALTLGKLAVFRPENSLTLDDPLRGLWLENDAKIETVAGVTLTTRVPITWHSNTVYKTGAGTWELGGTCRESQSNVKLCVSEGALRAGASYPLGMAKLEFADGTRYEIDADAAGFDERSDYGFVVKGGMTIAGVSLPVTVTASCSSAGLEQALFTVPAAQAAEVAIKLVPEARKNCTAEIVVGDPFALDGVSMSTISVKYTLRGAVLIIR